MKIRYIIGVLILTMILGNGCARLKPTMAHVHIGHALTGWYDTPGKEGLFVVSEKKAREALTLVELATQEKKDMPGIKLLINQVIKVTNAKQIPDSKQKQYGVKQALAGAVDHITFAAESEDASQNVKVFAKQFQQDVKAVFDRCALITALGKDIENSTSKMEVSLLAEEVKSLVKANMFGEDSNGDGVPGNSPREYGLLQLRRRIEKMLDREDPPYTTVSSWYLFNIIRLPDGRWIFRNRFEDKDDIYAGGGGGGY